MCDREGRKYMIYSDRPVREYFMGGCSCFITCVQNDASHSCVTGMPAHACSWLYTHPPID